MVERLEKLKERLFEKATLKHGIIMVAIYPIYLFLFDYVKHSNITMILTILFVIGITLILSKTGNIKENKEGEKQLVRRRKEPYGFKDIIDFIKSIISKKSLFIVLLLMCSGISKAQLEILPAITIIPPPAPIAEVIPPGALVVTGAPVHDEGLTFMMKLKAIEDNIAHAGASIRGLETVTFLRHQLINIRETRDKIQKAYDLQEKIRNDLKKVKALKDFSVADAVYLSEKVLGESLNPADYMIRTNWKWHEDLKRSLSYDAGSQLSSDAKSVYRFLTQYREGDTVEVARFDEIADVLGFESDWRNYDKEQAIRAMLAKRRVAEMKKKNLKTQYDLVSGNDTLSMDDGKRMELILSLEDQMAKVEEDISISSKDFLKMMEEQNQRESFFIKKIAEEMNTQQSYNNIVMYHYNKNKGFKMVDYRIEKNGSPRLSNRGLFRTR